MKRHFQHPWNFLELLPFIFKNNSGVKRLFVMPGCSIKRPKSGAEDIVGKQVNITGFPRFDAKAQIAQPCIRVCPGFIAYRIVQFALGKIFDLRDQLDILRYFPDPA
jgi:hypothetical protein